MAKLIELFKIQMLKWHKNTNKYNIEVVNIITRSKSIHYNNKLLSSMQELQQILCRLDKIK